MIKKSMLHMALILLCVVLSKHTISAKPPVTKWTVKAPFEDKVFIKNEGQFALGDKSLNAGDIFFGANLGGLQYYFTKNSIWIEHSLTVKRLEQQIAMLKEEGDKPGNKVEDLNLQYEIVNQTYQIYFEDANTNVQIEGVGSVSQAYNFRMGNSSIKAQAYKKITYTNLYPGIDMDFYFPDNKSGFEYDFIVHPGADVSKIKMQYPLNSRLNLTDEGNIQIKSVYGDFIDHAPVVNQVGNFIPSSFKIENGTVKFNVGSYDKNKPLIIDPWVAVPGFNHGRKDACFVDYDDGGNCYIYGGEYHYEVAKYNSNGVLQWITTEAFTSNVVYPGHFGVDRVSQSVYMVEGYNTNGAEIIKLNKAGAIVAMDSGNTNCIEMWRIAFSRCNPHQAVVGGGNTTNAPFNSGFVLDTTLKTKKPVNILNAASGFKDVCLLALDNARPNSNAYLGYCNSGHNGNILIKVPTPALTPIAWNVDDGYRFSNANSVVIGVGNGGVEYSNGFSGMTYGSGNNLYTYDSYKLKKWNVATGALVSSKTLNTNSHGDSLMFWAGLSADICDNIFVGSQKEILQYDANLNLINTISAPDTVFDVKLGNGNILYACGGSFVEAIQVNVPLCLAFTIDTTVVNATCHKKGEASVSINGGTPPYLISWTDLGSAIVLSSSMNADSLPGGTYVVTVTESSCMSEQLIDTVHILDPGVTSLDIEPRSPKICVGQNVSLNVKGGGANFIWSPSTGLNATTGDTVLASPSSTIIYSVSGNNSNGCFAVGTDTVFASPGTALDIEPQLPEICAGESVALYIQGGGTNFTWTPSTGLSAVSGDTVIANPTIDITYTVTGNNSSGCASTGTDRVIVDSCKSYVWPGDANNDLGVDNYDLIPIGLYYNESGTSRSVVTNAWAAQASTDWGTLQQNGYDKKFVDCNGDGTINSDDTLAIALNYGNTHLFHAPHGSFERTSGVSLHFIADSNYYEPGSTVHVAVLLGDTSQSTNIYALGYVIGLNTSLIKTGTLAFSYNTSFVGTKNIDALSLTHLKNDVETAVTRTDHHNKRGYGKIGDLYFALSPAISDSEYILSFDSYKAVDSIGNPVNLSPLNDTIVIRTKTGIDQVAINNKVSIYPNPSSGMIMISSTNLISDVKITNVLGQVIYVVHPKKNKVSFSLTNDGMYFISITSGGETSTAKVIVSR